MENFRKLLENWTSLFDIQWGWLSLPDMKNPEKNRRAQLLWRILWGITFSGIFIFLLSIINYSLSSSVSYIAAFVIIFSMLILLFIRQGYVTLASWVYFSVSWLFIGIIAALSWGVQPIYLFGQILIVFMAILLINVAAGYFFFFLSLMFMGVMLALPPGWQADFGISPAFVQLPFWLTWLWFAIVGMIVISLTRHSMVTALTGARTLEQRFRALFESINDAVFVITFDLRIFGVNYRASRMVGYDTFDLMRMGLSDLMSMEDFDKFMRIRDQVLNEQSISIFQIEMTHSDGHKVNVEASIGSVRDDSGQPQYFQVIARDITDRTRLQARVQRSLNEMALLARTDTLTGILNRRAIEELGKVLLIQAEENKMPVTVVMIDMDDLKEINDQYGHYSGDRALIYLSTMLQNLVGENAHVARWGGDEFLVLMQDQDLDSAWIHAEYWRRQITDKKLALDMHLIDLKVSMGVATLMPDDNAVDLETLVQWADKALYDAKANGKNSVGRYE